MLQNIKTKDFLLTGTVESQRVADDGKILSYNILTDKGYSTTRHRRFLRPLVTALDPEIPKESAVCNDGETIDLPNFADKTEKPGTTRAPLRRSTGPIRRPVQFDPSKQTVKLIKMCKAKPEITVSKEDLGICQKKVDYLEQLITTYSGEKAE